MMLNRPFLSAVLLTLLTFVIALTVSRLPYSETRDVITDTLTLPGGFIASLVYPEGVHTGHGAPNWALMTMLSNVLVYLLFWYLLLKIVGRFYGRAYDAKRRN